MAKYRVKQIVTEIEAEQFLPPHQIPQGVMNVYSSPHGYAGEVWTIQGEKVIVRAGEWIVQESTNPKRFYPIADEIFRAKYELCNLNVNPSSTENNSVVLSVGDLMKFKVYQSPNICYARVESFYDIETQFGGGRGFNYSFLGGQGSGSTPERMIERVKTYKELQEIQIEIDGNLREVW